MSQKKRRYQEYVLIMEQRSTKNSNEEWFSMEDQRDSGFQGIILQVPHHHWRILSMSTIDTDEERNIMALDVPKAFL